MTQLHIFGFFVLLASALEVSSRSLPSNKGTVQYTALYGGGKGQYLEIIKDESGQIVSEKVVPESKIKNKEENEDAAALSENLKEVNTLSKELSRLLAQGQKKGSLNDANAATFQTKLEAMKESSANLIAKIEFAQNDIDALFTKKTKKYDKNNGAHYDYVEQDGVGVDASQDEQQTPENENRGLVAEAKPIGLAVVGESGLAAARPMGTAIAASGIALARPIGTAVAGIDPAALGLSFDFNQKKY